MRRACLLLAACGILTAAGVAHGLRTDRWGPSPDLRAAVERLDGLPTRVGDWEGAPLAIDPGQVKAAHVAGMTGRRFTHRFTRAEVFVLVVTGRPGPVAVHTPDVCYATAGFVPSPPEAKALPGEARAWAATFTKPGPPAETLRISWAWSDGGEWVAAGSPRTAFARAGVLHKLYVIRPVTAPADEAEQPPELDLLAQFLPEVRARIAPGGNN